MQKSVLAGPFPSSPLVTNAELLASGLTHSAICKRVQRGVLLRRYPGVYSHGPGDLSREVQWLAATLACGKGAVLGQLSVAALFDVSRWPDDGPHVLVPRRHWPVEGIVIHHCLGLDPRAVTVVRFTGAQPSSGRGRCSAGSLRCLQPLVLEPVAL